MKNIEEVKKILNSDLNPKSPYRPDGDYYPMYAENQITSVARQIRQLFEPKPNESRLLTDEEIVARWGAHPTTGDISVYRSIAQIQDAKTYPIAFEDGHKAGIQKCQLRVERILREVEGTFKLGGYDPDRLEALKKQEGVR